jgi:hypothetical protein
MSEPMGLALPQFWRRGFWKYGVFLGATCPRTHRFIVHFPLFHGKGVGGMEKTINVPITAPNIFFYVRGK